MSYQAFKVVHLFGVVIFLGNIIVTAAATLGFASVKALQDTITGFCAVATQ
jgi:hypothetical protein